MDNNEASVKIGPEQGSQSSMEPRSSLQYNMARGVQKRNNAVIMSKDEPYSLVRSGLDADFDCKKIGH